MKIHELLETETITASVLRYKLQYFPSDIKSEIQGMTHFVTFHEVKYSYLTKLTTRSTLLGSYCGSGVY